MTSQSEETKVGNKASTRFEISRRGFIGTAATVTAAALMGGVVGCSPASSENKATGAESTQNAAGGTAKGGGTLLPNLDNLEFYKPIGGAEVSFVADAIPENEIVDTIDVDVVICGAGIAGATAAVSSSENGLKTVVLEKGSTFAARGTEIGAIGDRVHEAAGTGLNGMDILNDAMAISHYRCDRNVWMRWIERSGEALDWAMDTVGDACGEFYCKASTVTYASVTTWATGVRLEKGISSYVEAMLGIAEDSGVEVHYETPACQLVTDDAGTVTGVIAKGGKGYVRYNASKGVILATGGYEYNWDLMTQTVRPKDLAVYAWINPTKTNTGDGYLMGRAIGALEDDYPHVLMNDPAGALSGNRANGAMLSHLRVNENGERFVNENLSFEYMSNAVMYQQGAHDFVLMAGDILAALEKAKGGAPWTPEAMYESIQDVLIEAETLEELAETCGINYENLMKTVERYNELCDLGEDLDYGKAASMMIPLKEGPYYAVDESGCCLVAVSGLRTTPEAQVLGVNGKAIKNLYALGNVGGSMFFGTYPHNISAVSHGRCVTFGYLLGRYLAGLEN